MSAVASSNSYYHGEKVAFGLITQLILEGQPQSEIDMIIEFQRTVGLPITLAEVGIDSADEGALDLIAETTVAPGETCHHEPFEVRADAIKAAMLAADALGRAAS
jgi:glycerol dehydrogenase